MTKIAKIDFPVLADVEWMGAYTKGESPQLKVKIPVDIIERLNAIIEALNELSENKIIRSAIALEKKKK